VGSESSRPSCRIGKKGNETKPSKLGIHEKKKGLEIGEGKIPRGVRKGGKDTEAVRRMCSELKRRLGEGGRAVLVKNKRSGEKGEWHHSSCTSPSSRKERSRKIERHQERKGEKATAL